MSNLSRPSRALIDAARAGSRLDPALKASMRSSLRHRLAATTSLSAAPAVVALGARAPWINLVLVALGVSATALDGEVSATLRPAATEARVAAHAARVAATASDGWSVTARGAAADVAGLSTARTSAAHRRAPRPLAAATTAVRPATRARRIAADDDEPWPELPPAPQASAPSSTDDERLPTFDDDPTRTSRAHAAAASSPRGPWEFELGASLSAPIQMRLPVLGDEPQPEVSLRLGVARRVTSHLRVAGNLLALPWTFGAEAHARMRVAADVRAYVALSERGFDGRAQVSAFVRAGAGWLDGARNDPRAGGPVRGVVGVGFRVESGASRGVFVAAEASWVLTLPEAHAVETSLLVGLRP